MKYHRAQDTFVSDLKDGSPMRVNKGDVLPENHELVKRDMAGSGQLFRPLDDGEDDAPRSGPAARAAAKLTGKS